MNTRMSMPLARIDKPRNFSKLSQYTVFLVILIILISSMPVALSEEDETAPWQGPNESQFPPLFVRVDANLYFPEEQLRISGFVKQLNANNPVMPVSLHIADPTGEFVFVAQIIPDTDGRFSTSLTAGGPVWKYSGQYTINVVYDRQKASTIFDYMTERPGSGTIDLPNNELEQLFHSQVFQSYNQRL